MSLDPLASDQIQTAVRRALADASVESVTNVSTQPESVSYDLRLSNQMDVTLKVYTGRQADGDAKHETRLLRLVTSETGVPTPRVLYQADELAGAPLSWALFTRVPGQALSRVADLLDSWETETIGYEIGRYLSHVHQLGLDEFGSLFTRGTHNHSREKAYLLAQVNEWLENCTQNALLLPEAAAAFRRHLLETQLLGRDRACLIHGALGPGSIMVEKGGAGFHVTGILGFGQAQGGSPEFDIASLFDWPGARTPAFQKGFLDGYAESGELPAQFWDRLALYQAVFCLSKIGPAREQADVDSVQAWRARLTDYTNQFLNPL